MVDETEGTTQRHMQYWTQDTARDKGKPKSTTQKTSVIVISNTDPSITRW